MFRIPAPELQSWLATSHSYSDRNGREPGGSTRDPNGAIVSTMPTEMLAASHLTCFSFESPELLELWVIGRYFRGPSAICHLARQLPICYNFTTEPPTFSFIFFDIISHHKRVPIADHLSLAFFYAKLSLCSRLSGYKRPRLPFLRNKSQALSSLLALEQLTPHYLLLITLYHTVLCRLLATSSDAVSRCCIA